MLQFNVNIFFISRKFEKYRDCFLSHSSTWNDDTNGREIFIYILILKIINWQFTIFVSSFKGISTILYLKFLQKFDNSNIFFPPCFTYLLIIWESTYIKIMIKKESISQVCLIEEKEIFAHLFHFFFWILFTS